MNGSFQNIDFKVMPLIGIFVFIILYAYSSTLYPGGSQASDHSVGYDWIHNYWCNLTNEIAVNGQINPARPFAISALIILCFSMTLFFYFFSQTYSKNLFWKKIIQIGGFLSMSFAVFIFTEYHDSMTILSSLIGVFVVIGVIREVYLSNLFWFKITGFICLILLALNNFIYYSEEMISYLPLLQKISLSTLLTWVTSLNLKLIKESK